ncbi:MAG: KdsC family phosphatase [Rubrivivax sp.]|jgi:3-deoxy-D-manno-octulosonate 8-phosphate phosphatase (KDO 8-P phosphatase)
MTTPLPPTLATVAPPRPAPPAGPVLRFDPELLLRAQGQGGGVRAALFDVDGVLTDGRLYIGEAGEVFKAFHVLDGHGIKLLAACGIEPVVVTGRDSPAVRRRLADLGVRHAAFGAGDKLAAATPLLATLGVEWAEVAVIGDDWPDLPLLQRAAVAVAPPGAHPEVRARVHHVTTAGAGQGAAREFCDLLLTAAGHYARLLQAHGGSLDTR